MRKALQSEKVYCDKCPDSEAVSFCKDCGNFICDLCQMVHKKWPEYSSHVIVNMDDMKEDVVKHVVPKKEFKTCSQHQKKLKIYCETCQILICRDCIVGQHRPHTYQLVQEVVAEHRGCILSRLELIRHQEEVLGAALAGIGARIGEVRGQGEQIKREVEEKIRQLHGILEGRKVELLAHVDQLVKEKAKSLSCQMDQLEMLQTQVSSCIQFTHESLRSGTDGDIVSIKTPVIQRIDEILNTITEAKKDPQQKADIYFKSTQYLVSECQQFGHIKINPDEISKCYVESDRFKTAAMNEEIMIPIFSLNKDGSKSLHTPANAGMLTSTLVAKGDVLPSQVIRKVEENTSMVAFKPVVRGANRVHIKENGEDIEGSPFPVYVYNPTPTTTIEINKPNSIQITDKELIVVGSTEHVSIYSKDGKTLRSFKLKGKELPQPYGSSIDSEGFLLITDKSNSCVTKCTLDGIIITSVGKKGNQPLEFNGVCGIATNKTTGKVYIADRNNHRIQVLNSDLTFSHFLKRGLHQPHDVAVGGDGSVYVSDIYYNQIRVFSPKGEYIREFGNRENDNGNLKCPTGLCADSNNNIFVSDHGNHRICMFDTKGEFFFSFGKRGQEPGEFASPYGIASDSEGVIHVADYGNNRVQIF